MINNMENGQVPKLCKQLSLILVLCTLVNLTSRQIQLPVVSAQDSDSFDDGEIIDLDEIDPKFKSHSSTQQTETTFLTEEMEDLINGIKPGGSSNWNGPGYGSTKIDVPTITKRRTKKSKSRSDANDNADSGDERSSSSSNPKKSAANADDATISTKVSVTIPGYGKAVGRREQAVDSWKGIPYCAPPVGSLRFAPPEAATPWAPSKLDASQYGPDCYQLVDPVLNPLADINHMSEDCLYLNVFTPAGHARSRQGKFISGPKKLPVMLWFHGGAFQQGSGGRPEYDGKKLAERDIIVVTINYRLGSLGFLVSSPDGLYGNFGLMDQRAALDWVKNNIVAFGGDPDNITLFGESAGAVMIGLHLLMEGAGTLFHKAIMQSNPLGYTFRSVIVADFIGEALKKNVDCRDLACLRAERIEEIMRAQSSLMGVPRSVGDFFTFGPTLTSQRKLKLALTGESRFFSRSEENRSPRLDTDESHNSYVSEWRVGTEVSTDTARWSAVNVSQPLKMLETIPSNIPIIVGNNKNEGEMFVHSAFPAPVSFLKIVERFETD
jgi:carboxylesterase type B